MGRGRNKRYVCLIINLLTLLYIWSYILMSLGVQRLDINMALDLPLVGDLPKIDLFSYLY